MINMTKSHIYISAMAVSVVGLFLLIWLSLGIGIIGEDGNPSNIIYALVVAIGIIGAVSCRFKPRGMAFTLFAMTLTQTGITAVAIILKAGMPWSPPLELLGLNGIFVFLFGVAGLLFCRARKE